MKAAQQPRNNEVESAVAETRYLLENWQVSAYSTGLFWIAPLRRTFRPEELASLLVLLSRACDEALPRMIKFDLSQAHVEGEQWTVVESLLAEFARSVGGRPRIITGVGQPSAVIVDRGPSGLPEDG